MSFGDNTSLSVIDFGEVHLYPDIWGISQSDATNWITDHTAIAKKLGKPMLIGEFGANDHSIYQSWMTTVEAGGTAGALLWELVSTSRGVGEPSDVVYPTDTQVIGVLKTAAAAMTAK